VRDAWSFGEWFPDEFGDVDDEVGSGRAYPPGRRQTPAQLAEAALAGIGPIGSQGMGCARV
jgi:hypothetical protein